MCIQNRENILGEIVNHKNVGVGALDNPKIALSDIGKIIEKHIKRTNQIYENIIIDKYVIMPNHLHCIIIIDENGEAGLLRVPDTGSSRAPTPTMANATIPALISTFKRFVNKECGYSIWQRNYYEHIIRNEKEYYRIAEYIKNNPMNWKEDKYY